MTPTTRLGIYQLYVPRPSGGVVRRSCGTSTVTVYRGMKRMLTQLKDERRWTLLQAVCDKRLTLGQLYDAWSGNSLAALEAQLDAQALAPLIVRYLADCRTRGLAPRNIQNVTRQLASFTTFGARTTADLSTATVTDWLASLTTTPGTRRQYAVAVTGLTRFLYDRGVLTDYPLGRLKLPKPNASRMRHETVATDEAIVQACSPKYQGVVAFIHATGCDVSTALRTLRRDVDLARMVASLRGTKTARRSVHEALVEPWAIPYLDVSRILPNAPLFPRMSRNRIAQHHKATTDALGVSGYTLRDSRHSIAVRMLKAQYNVQEVAEQLGNTAELVAKVYSRYVPRLAHKTPTVTAQEAVR